MDINNTGIGGVSPADVPKKYRLSRLSLTFGIMSLVLLPIFSLPGLITGLLASSKEKEAKKFFVPGIITSAVSIVLVVVCFALVRGLLAIFGLSFSNLKDLDHVMEVVADYLVAHSVL